MNKNKHGGKRPGAGRPSAGHPRIKTSITIDVELKKWVDAQPDTLSELVNEGLELLKRKRDLKEKLDPVYKNFE